MINTFRRLGWSLGRSREPSEDTLTLPVSEELAFERIYNQKLPVVKAKLHQMLGPQADIDGLAQEVFIKYLMCVQRDKKATNPSALLMKITADMGVDQYRIRSRGGGDQPVEVLPEGAAWFSTAAISGPEEAFELAEVMDAMDKILSPELRLSLVMRGPMGLSRDEVAEALDIEPASVTTNVRRAKEKLQHHFADKRTGSHRRIQNGENT
ncbi:RNA polymerase sigma factor [Streptomyces sp. NPDC057616]|uniref:RNA polymerase sigma factor n=1 Tax=Streptomyces sp. NPDC057616 TaxID=3346183 RepID=UPI0036A536C5